MPPPGPTGLEHLPEPSALHASLSARRPLDWGDALPTKEDIAAKFGQEAATRSLTLLARAADAEPRVTADLVSSVSSGVVPYQLENRIKSPQSLARKLDDREGTRFATQPVEDLLRYTFVTPEPDDLVRAAKDACDTLLAKGWTMDSAHHSYVNGSRYKGLHLFLRGHGELVELQIHSRESIDVKTRTTPLYVIERDRKMDRASRDAARETCIALSDQMTQPAGLDDLKTLGGVAVGTRSYGMRSPRSKGRPETDPPSLGEPSPTQQATAQRRSNATDKKGNSK
ncbi:MAG TPA: hypothetical protein VFG33_18160 [Kribbella sp.]|uniref:hypothetical protein n=1 Tax=Kribbella sp. TaxID=1871183 RepID=UPI002D77760C|nr:hypothetical protein [Kribbella sp.]HET6295315.1 hypothetical protein [Kribbella sp.]